jgi:hypothetical protein
MLPVDLITRALSVTGFPSVNAIDSEEAIALTSYMVSDFWSRSSLSPDVQKAHDYVLRGDISFKGVLVMDYGSNSLPVV